MVQADSHLYRLGYGYKYDFFFFVCIVCGTLSEALHLPQLHLYIKLDKKDDIFSMERKRRHFEDNSFPDQS